MSYNKLAVIHSYPIWLPQTQTWMHTQVRELQRRGVETHIVCEKTINLDQFGVVNIHCIAEESIWERSWDQWLRKLRVRRHLNYLVKIGRETSAQIIHSHFGNVGWVNLGAARKLDAKHVVTFYGYDVNKTPKQEPIWRVRYRQMFEEATLFLCEGTHMAQRLQELGCPKSKVQVQHLGVDLDQISFEPRRWSGDEPLKVLIAASFKEKKGIPYAIEALAQIRSEIPVEVTIIGEAGEDRESQAEKSAILNAIARTGLDDCTRLLGYQSHARLFEEAYRHHVFLHPSVTANDGDTEGGAPVVIIEMLATGMPVVSTRHCDIPEVMGELSNTLLAPERDVDALAKILRTLLSSRAEWASLMAMSRKHLHNEYEQSAMAGRMEDLYRSCLHS